MIDFECIARESGATNPEGHKAVTTFCFTKNELAEFVKKIGDEIVIASLEMTQQALSKNTYMGDGPPAICWYSLIEKQTRERK